MSHACKAELPQFSQMCWLSENIKHTKRWYIKHTFIYYPLCILNAPLATQIMHVSAMKYYINVGSKCPDNQHKQRGNRKCRLSHCMFQTIIALNINSIFYIIKLNKSFALNFFFAFHKTAKPSNLKYSETPLN